MCVVSISVAVGPPTIPFAQQTSSYAIAVRHEPLPAKAAPMCALSVTMRHRRHLHRRLQLRGRNLTMTNGLCEASPLSPPPSLYKLNSLIQTIFNDFKLTSNH